MSTNVLAALEGGEELRKALRKVSDQVVDAMETHLPKEAETLMQQANALVPARSGELKASALVSSAVNKKRSKVRAAAAYLSEYAAAVHEGMFGGRKARQPPASYKWFERAYHAFEPGAISRIVGVLRGIVNGD